MRMVTFDLLKCVKNSCKKRCVYRHSRKEEEEKNGRGNFLGLSKTKNFISSSSMMLPFF